jgi:hypothetical protein
MTKSYKREVAAVFMACDLGLWLMSAMGNGAATHPAETLLPYAVALVAGAFGFHAYVSQLLPAKTAHNAN